MSVTGNKMDELGNIDSARPELVGPSGAVGPTGHPGPRGEVAPVSTLMTPTSILGNNWKNARIHPASTSKIHVVGLPYLPVCKEYSACAFTSRIYKFCEIMSQKYEVLLYGLAGSNAPTARPCYEILGRVEREEFYGSYDGTKVCYAEKPVNWDPADLPWQMSNVRAAYWIKKNLGPKDFVCIIGGRCQKHIADLLLGTTCQIVEFGIGYLGTFAKRRVFDSYAHMHQVYGRESSNLPQGCDGQNYDAVIPNPYDLSQFTPTTSPSNYCLYVGRLDTSRKGIKTAVEATRRAGKRLILAGQGVASAKDGEIICNDGSVYSGSHLQYDGVLSIEKRNNLMRHAESILVPSEYLEPFGGVNVEAQLCGTPAITTDFGAFPETVEHGVSGYRCRTLEQFVWAVNNAHKLDRDKIAQRARSLYSMERVGRMYHEYFAMLSTLWGEGWFANNPNRENLNWLEPLKEEKPDA